MEVFCWLFYRRGSRSVSFLYHSNVIFWYLVCSLTVFPLHLSWTRRHLSFLVIFPSSLRTVTLAFDPFEFCDLRRSDLWGNRTSRMLLDLVWSHNLREALQANHDLACGHIILFSFQQASYDFRLCIRERLQLNLGRILPYSRISPIQSEIACSNMRNGFYRRQHMNWNL